MELKYKDIVRIKWWFYEWHTWELINETWTKENKIYWVNIDNQVRYIEELYITKQTAP